MNDITFEPEDASFEDFMNNLSAIPAPNIDLGVDEAEFSALIDKLAQGSPASADLDATQPEFDPQELEAWLNSLDPTTVGIDL